MEHADSLDSKASDEEDFLVINSSSDDLSEDSRARVTLEESHAVGDVSITTSGGKNVFGKITESNSADSTGHVISLNKVATHHLPDRDERIALNQDIDNTPSENLNENGVENFDASKTGIEKACGWQDCSQAEKLKSNDPLHCNYNPFEKFEVNQPFKLDICDVDKLVMNHIQESSETFGEVFTMPELSYFSDIEALLKRQKEFSESSNDATMDPEEKSNDKEENNNVENLSCNFTTHFELETETNGANSDICKSDFEIDSLPLVKSCFVVLQRCDSLVNKYFTNIKHSANSQASLLEMDAMSNISNTGKVNESISKDLKLKTRVRKFRKSCSMSNSDIDVAEPHPKTSHIKETKRKEEYLSFNDSEIFIGNETTEMKCNANKRDENVVEEDTSRLSLSISDASDIVDSTQDTLNTNDKNKKVPKNKSPLQNNHNSERDFDGIVLSKKSKVKDYLNSVNKNRCINKVRIKKKAKKRTKKILVDHSIAQIRDISILKSHEENFKTNKERNKKPGKRKSDMRDTLEINDTNKISNKNFKTNEAQEECAKKDDGLQFDVYQTELFMLSEHERERATDTSSDSFGACNNGINARKRFKRNKKNVKKTKENSIKQFSIGNISDIGNKSDEKNFLTGKYRSKVTKKDHDQQLNMSDDSEIDSDCNTSKENFKTHEYKKRKEVFETISTQISVSIERTEHELSSKKFKSHKKFMSVEHKEKNNPNYADKEYRNNELSDASRSLISSIFDQPEIQLDYSLLTKPCHVVLTRCDYIDSEKAIPSSSNNLGNFSLHSDLNKLSYLDCEGPQDLEGKIDNKAPKLFSVSSDQYEDSTNDFVKTANEQNVKLQISDLNEVRSTESANSSLDTSDTEIHLSINESSEQFRERTCQSKHKKFQNQEKAYVPDPSTSKGSGVNKELLEFYKNEFVHGLKELKKVMKRTERKMDVLIKLHKQVLNC